MRDAGRAVGADSADARSHSWGVPSLMGLPRAAVEQCRGPDLRATAARAHTVADVRAVPGAPHRATGRNRGPGGAARRRRARPIMGFPAMMGLPTGPGGAALSRAVRPACCQVLRLSGMVAMLVLCPGRK